MSDHSSPAESQALVATLAGVAPSSPTACGGWTAHDVVAHLTAGSKEIADLIEEKLAGRPERPTRGFAEREAPFAALPDEELREAMAAQGRRKLSAVAALSGDGDGSFRFTGRTFTVTQITTHSRSEAALHRWDLVGDDDVSEELLTQPELTRHAVDVLNTLPTLYEAPGWRADQAGVGDDVRIVLRSPGADDVVYRRTSQGARFEFDANRQAEGDALVTTDPANRLLTVWGRHSSERRLTVDTDAVPPETVTGILWPSAVPWPASARPSR